MPRRHPSPPSDAARRYAWLRGRNTVGGATLRLRAPARLAPRLSDDPTSEGHPLIRCGDGTVSSRVAGPDSLSTFRVVCAADIAGGCRLRKGSSCSETFAARRERDWNMARGKTR